MSFNKIIGHENHIEYLKNAIINNKLSHAFIFEGIDGIGKRLIGINLAKAVFCETQSGNACGLCRSCIKMDHNNHPDYMMIEPDGKTIKNAQIETFQEFAMIKPYDSNYKVVIIKDAEKMNASSQNRILKTLEEPPEYVVIILITNNSESLLPTVVSRCQIIKYNGLTNQQIKNYLIEKFDLSHDQADVISRLFVIIKLLLSKISLDLLSLAYSSIRPSLDLIMGGKAELLSEAILSITTLGRVHPLDCDMYS